MSSRWYFSSWDYEQGELTHVVAHIAESDELPSPPRKRDTAKESKLVWIVVIAVTTIWIVSGTVSLYTGDVRVFIAATPLMGGIIGALLGIGITRQNGK